MIPMQPMGRGAAVAALALWTSGAVAGRAAEFEVVLDNLASTLFSVSGAPRPESDGGPGVGFDIYAVGAESPDGRGPTLLRYRDGSWRRLATGATGDLWWVSDRPVGGSLYLCGSDGLILRLDPATLLIEREAAPGGRTLFGIWGTGPENLWAVGGDPADPARGGVVLRRDGSEWVVDPRVSAALPGGVPSIYKIWGRSAAEIWAVGLQGTALSFDGSGWSVVSTGTDAPLFTVSGDATRVVATGGAFDGVILELDGGGFTNRAPPGEGQINGVSLRDGAAAAVGLDGSLFTRGETAWNALSAAQGAQPLDLHGAWIDPEGGIWGVGGDLTIDRSYGAVAYLGVAQVAKDLAAGVTCEPGAAGSGGTVSYARDVYPLLASKGCLDSGCHGASGGASDYDLRSHQGLFRPGTQAFNLGACDVVPGDPDTSYLIEKLGESPRTGDRMPRGLPPLTAGELQLLRTWIAEGATLDAVPETPYSRGDVDKNGGVEITDAIAILGYLFFGATDALTCLKSADGNDDGGVDISDAVFLLGYLFLGGAPPNDPLGTCGTDPTEDGLDCVSYPPCG